MQEAALLDQFSFQANAAIFSGIIAGYLLKQGKFPDPSAGGLLSARLSRPITAAFAKTATETFNKVNASRASDRTFDDCPAHDPGRTA
jgi:uncharacterized protein (DUF697 family)